MCIYLFIEIFRSCYSQQESFIFIHSRDLYNYEVSAKDYFYFLTVEVFTVA